jgi:sortase A
MTPEKLLRIGIALSVVAATALVATVLYVVLAELGPPGEAREVATADLLAQTEEPVIEEPVIEEPTTEEPTIEEGVIDDQAGQGREPPPPAREPAPLPSAEDTPGEGEEEADTLADLGMQGDWPEPSREELKAASAPRRYSADPSASMTLTIPKLQVEDMPVLPPVEKAQEVAALKRGLLHLRGTDSPTDTAKQKNVAIAGHILGYPGTPSRLAFLHLDKLRTGDEVTVAAGGKEYKYKVTERFAVRPEATWALGEIEDRDVLTLLTCTGPNFQHRLVVRLDRA